MMLSCNIAMSQESLTLTPQGCTLADKNGKLTKDELKTMFDAELYGSYLQAHRKIVDSDILFSVSGASFLVGSIWFAAIPLYYSHPLPPRQFDAVDMTWLVYGAIGTISYVVALSTGIPAIVIHKKGKSEMREVANRYNSRHSLGLNSVTIQPTLGVNTVGLCVKF